VAPEILQPGDDTAPAAPEVTPAARPSTGARVVNGIGRGFTIVVGVVWLVIGSVSFVAACANPGSAAIGFIAGPLIVLYAIYLLKPGGWKFIIY
jgi:hypothetical protein